MEQEKTKTLIYTSIFEKKEAVEKLIEESSLTKEFYFLLFSSTSIITLGLALDNASVIIGGMLITPLFSPLLKIGLGIILSNKNIIIKNFISFLKLFGLVAVTSLIISFIINVKEPTIEILLRTSTRYEYFLVALIAGFVGTYFWIKPNMQNLISGIIIAVALVPPISCLGIGISLFNKDIVVGSLVFFILNFIGILFGSVFMFSLSGFGRKEKKSEEALEKKLEQDCQDNKNSK
jgi:uncharacterized hydrophobic protein (TIGR00271 family)